MKRIFKLIVILFCIVGVVFGISVILSVSIPKISMLSRKDNLKQLSILLMLYQQDWGAYPTVQSKLATQGGGVEDLYPLYATGLLKDKNLYLLQPKYVKLKSFPKNPQAKDFNQETCGIAYNSTAFANQHVPLLVDLVAPEDGQVLVLFADQKIEQMTVGNSLTNLSSRNIIANEDWDKLQK